MNRLIRTSTRSSGYLLFLLVLAAFLAGISLLIGPRVVEVEEKLLQPRQSLEVSINSKLSKVESVDISPHIDHSIVMDDYSFTIYFTEQLTSSKTYAVTATLIDINGENIPFEYNIRTSDSLLYYLHRDSDGLDQIRRTDINNSFEDILLERADLLTFTVSNATIYVLEQTENGDELHAINIKSGKRNTLLMRESTLITSLESTPYSDILLINATADDFEPMIFILDSSSFRDARLLEEQATVIDGSRSQLIEDSDSFIYFQDYTTLVIDDIHSPGNPQLIGSVNDYLDTTLEDTAELLIRRNNSLQVLQASGDTSELPAEIPDFVGYAQFYNGSNSFLYLDHQIQNQNITLYQDGTVKILNKFPRSTSIIRNLTLSVDNQNYNVEIMPANSRIRTDLRINNLADETVTELYNVQTGNKMLTLQGINLVIR